MKIANYGEFAKALDGLFSAAAINDVAAYQVALAQSKQKYRQQTVELLAEIKKLKLQIEKYKKQIKQAKTTADKKAVGQKLNNLLSTKTALIKKNKELSGANAFALLNNDAKVYVCTRHLLGKYLTQAILAEAQQVNPHQDKVYIDIEAFKNDRVYQDAAHIRDYVSSYIENYPERVKGSRYFIGIHKQTPNFSALLADINLYFEKLNSPEEKQANQIKKSHAGISPVAVYKNEGLQLVKVETKAALNYEGSTMHHCVGSYATKVEKGETQIYSIRDLADAEHELAPHATIEFNQGKIKQIKGPHDSAVGYGYIDATRQAVMRLIKAENFEAVINNADLPDADKQNIGIYKATDQKYYDLFGNMTQDVVFENISLNGDGLCDFPFKQIKVNHLKYRGEINKDLLAELYQMQIQKSIRFSALSTTDKVLDLSDYPYESLTLDFAKAENLEQIILSDNLYDFSLTASMAKLKIISGGEKLRSLALEGTFDALHSLPVAQTIKVLKLKGKFKELKQLPLGSNTESLTVDAKLEQMACLDLSAQSGLQKIELGKDAPIIIFPQQNSALQSIEISGNDTMEEFIIPAGLQTLKLSEKYPHMQRLDFSQNNTLKNLELSLSEFPQLQELDLSQNENLLKLDMLAATFTALKTLKLPPNLQYWVTDTANLGQIEELDMSQLPMPSFGRITYEPDDTSNAKITYDTDEQENCCIDFHMPNRGCCFQITHFSKLKRFILPDNAVEVNLVGLHLPKQAKIEFNNLKKLESLEMFICEIPQKTIDLSGCDKLKSVSAQTDIAARMILPPQVKSLELHGSGENNNEPAFDFTPLKQLNTLKCQLFLPSEKMVPAAVKNLFLVTNRQDLSRLKEINLQRFENGQLMISSETKIDGLQRVAFAKHFEASEILQTLPNLRELDFSQTQDIIYLTTTEKYEELKAAAKTHSKAKNILKHYNILQLTAEQLTKVQTIKLGPNAQLKKSSDLRVNPHLQIITQAQPMNIRTLFAVTKGYNKF